METTAVVVNFS
ncbi:hypothetical protein E2C01_094239 [Portunus trituberculatus]|uniref:Uncharacterized protein n=1 Tax=Portunus trituberculatus TaxID=210409 RepID=A0A5B7K2K5_PORTR|nr:hypothetical protein [Portunus trituberculatus]